MEPELILAKDRERLPRPPRFRTAAPAAAREGPPGRRIARGVARASPGTGQWRLRGSLRSLVQTSVRHSAAPLSVDAAHRACNRAATRQRLVDHPDRLRHRLAKSGYLRPAVPR